MASQTGISSGAACATQQAQNTPPDICRGRNSMKRRTKRSVALGLLAPLLGTFIAFTGASAALAAEPLPPEEQITEPFQAPLCTGNVSDPRVNNEPVGDLTMIFGERITDYNAGRMVVLYNTNGSYDGETPVCGTRHVAGIGAVSEWMYCTDFTSHFCVRTNTDGRLVELVDGVEVAVDPLEDLESNPRLTADQERLVRHILTTEFPVKTTDGTVVISDEAVESREARQRAVWCITDYSPELVDLVGSFCDTNFSEAQQQAMLDSLPEDPVFEPVLSTNSSSTVIEPGATVEVEVTSNIYDTPITAEAPGAEVRVCPASADLAAIVDGQLVFNPSESPTETVRLCVTWQAAGAHSIDFSVTPDASTTQALTWVQSPTLIDGIPCQVHSNFNSVSGMTLTSNLLVNVEAPVDPVDPIEPVDPVDPVESVESGEPETPKAPVGNTGSATLSGGHEGSLAVTGSDSFLPIGALGVLLAGMGAAAMMTRKQKRATRS